MRKENEEREKVWQSREMAREKKKKMKQTEKEFACIGGHSEL